MTKVNFTPSDFKRTVAKADSLILKNRYFEQNPFLTDDGASLLARPGLVNWLSVGEGPIRGIYSEPGGFNGDLFVVSYDTLYRVTKNQDITSIQSGLFSPDTGIVNMAITGNIDETPEYLFIADGRILYVYIENGYATGVLTGTPANNDVVRIGSIYYKFTRGSVDTGTPNGTSGNPWLVALGGSADEAFQNIGVAVTVTGTAGSQYSTATTANPDAVTTAVSSNTLQIRATATGVLGNGVVTTETGAALSWTNGGTLIDGGDASCTPVQMPDDVGVIDVAVINSFVIVIPVQGEGINGRFYWIEPGETTVDPLNFATAERSPDAVFGVEVIGDQFMLPGEATTEMWYVTGDLAAPMARVQGVVFDRGTWEGTAVAINETLIVCDADGRVYAITGGNPTQISTPDITEQIRSSIQKQQSLEI